VVDVPEPKAPGVNEALIGIEIAALTKYDLLSISKALGEGPALPTIVGTEGFGRVLAVGRDVENVKVGDRVLAPPLSQTWREKLIAAAENPLRGFRIYARNASIPSWSVLLLGAIPPAVTLLR
jgi:NADPH:quinone reductase-like Zn-dependent oxidoreductase